MKSNLVPSLALLLLMPWVTAMAAPRLELLPNFHTLGIVVHLDNIAQANGATVEYRGSGDSSYRQGQPLPFVQGMVAPRLAGSLFNLIPGETYTVRVRISGGSANGTLLQRSVTTRAETELTIPAGLTRKYVAPNGSGSARTSRTN